MPLEWVTKYGSMHGTPYRVLEDTSVIPILPLMLDCCVYIYETEQDAKEGTLSRGGTGFWVKVAHRYHYVVTARHVLEGIDNPVLRINQRDNEGREQYESLVTNRHRWVDHPTDDLSVLPIDVDPSEFSIHAIEPDDFVNAERNRMISPGDEVFMIGRFISHEGKTKNSPSVRFGNISMLATETMQNVYGNEQPTYLIEQRSLPGYSGSPVMVYLDPSQPRPPYWQANMTRSGKIRIDPLTTGPWFLGVDWVHIHNYEAVLEDQQGTRTSPRRWVKSHTGMAGVLPAWRLAEFLNSSEELNMQREKYDERREKEKSSHLSYDSVHTETETQTTPKGVEIPIPDKSHFFDDLKKASRKKE